MTVGLSVLFLYSLNTGFTSLLNFGRRVSTKYYHTMLALASFPGLHAQLLSLAVRKAGEGLDGLIT